MNLAEMRRALHLLRAEINALLEMPDMTPADSVVLRERLEEVERLRARWDVLNAQYQREKGITSW